MNRIAGGIALALVLGAAGAAAASPLQQFGFGGRAPAMAGTGVATADELDAAYLNPAGLAHIDGRHVYAGTLLGTFALDGIDRPIDDAIAMELGVAARIPFGGWLKDRVGIAIGTYFPRQVLTKVRAPPPGVPFFALLENRHLTIGVQGGVGVKITDEVSVGLGILALGAVRARLDVITDTAGRIAATTEASLVSHIAPIFGARWDPSPALSTGVVVRFASRSRYEIIVNSELEDEIPLVLPEIRLAGVAQYDPLIVAAEAGWRPRPDVLVSAQLAWERWSRFPRPTENPVVGAPAPASPGFHDVVIPRLSVEHTREVGDDVYLLGRAGYSFHPTPARGLTPDRGLVDNHRHVAGAGAGVDLPEARVPLSIDVWFQTHILQERTLSREGMDDVTTSGAIYVGGVMMSVAIE